MPHERFTADDPREWINRARSNLVQATTRHPDIYLEDLCFQAQQATEKAIKAVLLHVGAAFPYTHDISRLMTIAEEAGVTVPEDLQEAVVLTQYAVVTRYPGIIEEVTNEEYDEAVALAAKVIDWAEIVVGSPS